MTCAWSTRSEPAASAATDRGVEVFLQALAQPDQPCGLTLGQPGPACPPLVGVPCPDLITQPPPIRLGTEARHACAVTRPTAEVAASNIRVTSGSDSAPNDSEPSSSSTSSTRASTAATTGEATGSVPGARHPCCGSLAEMLTKKALSTLI